MIYFLHEKIKKHSLYIYISADPIPTRTRPKHPINRFDDIQQINAPELDMMEHVPTKYRVSITSAKSPSNG